MEQLEITDLTTLFFASLCKCDACTEETCEDCNLWDVHYKTRNILKQNEIDINIT